MISVVMATYNSSKFVAETIESVLNQTYRRFEFIIVDDGSTDNTLEIIQHYLEKDDRIKLIAGEHRGASQARIAAIEVAKYSWIAIIDHDDVALPERFEKQIQAAQEKPHVVAWGSAIYHINAKGEILSVSTQGPTTEEEFYKVRREGHAVNLYHPTALINKETLLKAGGYRPEFFPADDIELFDRMADYGPILVLSEPLLLYRVHSHSTTMHRFFLQRNIMRYVRARHSARLAEKKNLSFEDFLAERRQWHWFRRLRKYLVTLGLFYYRKAGFFFGDKKYLQSAFYLGMSAILNPQYSIPRLWIQVFSTKARQLIEKSNYLYK